MKFKALSVAVMMVIVLLSAVPALAFWDEIGNAVTQGTINTGQIEDGVNALKGEITSKVPSISAWLDTIITFLSTYLGDVFGWLS